MDKFVWITLFVDGSTMVSKPYDDMTVCQADANLVLQRTYAWGNPTVSTVSVCNVESISTVMNHYYVERNRQTIH